MKVNRRELTGMARTREVTITLKGIEILLVASALRRAIETLRARDDHHNGIIVDRVHTLIVGYTSIENEAFEAFIKDADEIVAKEEKDTEAKADAVKESEADVEN